MTTNNNWQDLAADLPAPRDDEPASLRDDIVAELQDHLACALHRERHATGDEDRAQKNVIEKFGNPSAIAYRLWWDAMKERIMSQRILIGTVLLLAIACLAATGFAWIAVQEGREVNRAMLEKLSEMSLAVSEPIAEKAPDLFEWVPVRFKLLLKNEAGEPAESFSLGLSGKLFGTEEETTVVRKSGPDGIIELGHIKPGNYLVSVTSPWGATHAHRETITAGQPFSQTIVCPWQPLPEAEVQFDVNWPEDLKNQTLQLVCGVYARPQQFGPFIWSEGDSSDGLTDGFYWLVIQPNGNTAIRSHHHLDSPHTSTGIIKPNSSSNGIGIVALTFPDDRTVDFRKRVDVKGQAVAIKYIKVILPSMTALARLLDYNDSSFETLFDGRDSQRFPLVASWPQHLNSLPGLTNVPGKNRPFVVATSIIPDESTEPLTFVPKPGEENVWTIELPESLIARTREALQAIDEFEAEHAAVDADAE